MAAMTSIMKESECQAGDRMRYISDLIKRRSINTNNGMMNQWKCGGPSLVSEGNRGAIYIHVVYLLSVSSYDASPFGV